MLFDTPDRVSPRCEPAPEALLQRVQPTTPLFFASPQHTLLVDALHSEVPPGAAPLAQRVREALARAAAEGTPNPTVVGALPFDPAQVAVLGVAKGLQRAKPLPATAHTTRAHLRGSLHEVPSGDRYAAAVAEAVRRIRRGEVDKVVLARTLELHCEHPIAIQGLLAGLAARNPLGYNFAVALGDGRTLFGSSPELLVSRSGGVLRANPLAGSVPRSPDPVEDQRRAQALLVSSKDLIEHRLVVDAVAHALRPLCPQLRVPSRPSLVHTPTMWHLSTDISGRTEADALTLALALHPTPAVCGQPRSRAHELIQQLEPFERDFYAGAFGWTDANGDGEWVVAIRCAELQAQRLRLYAGAGIVAESEPAAELAETGAKFRTMLDALGLQHDVPQRQPAEVQP